MPRRAKNSDGGLSLPSRAADQSIADIEPGASRPNGASHEPEGRGEDAPRESTEPAEPSGIPVIDPIDIGEARPSGDAPRKRRGRTPKAEKVPADLTNLSGLILGAHIFCAALLSVPELEIDQSEADKLSDATKKLLSVYVVTMDPKKIAWGEFLMAAGAVYGPRAVAIWKRKPGPSVPTPGPQASVSEMPRPKATTPMEAWPQGGGSDYEA